MLKGLLVNEKEMKVIEIDDTLETYYKILDCECIDITTRVIGGKSFDIICDDEGLLWGDPRPSAIYLTPYGDGRIGQVVLVGNLFVCHGDDETGELVSLSDEDIELLTGQENNGVTYTKLTNSETGDFSPALILEQ